MNCRRTFTAFLCLMVAGVAGCGGLSQPERSTLPAPTTQVTAGLSATETGIPSPSASPSGEVIAATAAVATVVPETPAPSVEEATALPTPTSTPESAIGTGLSPLQLKFLLIDKFGPVGTRPGIFYCDPDFYPVARADEQSQAAKWFDAADKHSEEFRTLLQRLNMQSLASYSAQQQLQIYQEHKHLMAVTLTPSGDVYTFGLRVAQEANGRTGQALEGTITAQGDITILQQQPTVLTCPICLAQGTRIDTPVGPVAVQDIRPGMSVWTVTRTGERIAVPVVATAHTPVPAGHQVIDLRLSDGRELFASAGHPTADGRTVGLLALGDTLDGARVVGVDRTLYGATETYDILPAGETGFYWADGILIGSTLAPTTSAK